MELRGEGERSAAAVLCGFAPLPPALLCITISTIPSQRAGWRRRVQELEEREEVLGGLAIKS